MENVLDDKEFRKEVMYYKFPACGEDLYPEQLKRIFHILYRPDKERKKLAEQNEVVGLYNNKAMLYDEGERYKYILNGGKLLTSDTLKKITDPTESTVVSIFHHNDMDGDASAAIVNIFVSNLYFNNTVYHTAYGFNIDSITPSCDIARHKKVNGKYCIAFVVDIDLTEELYRQILSSFDEVVWIDHHPMALTMLNDKKFNLGKSQIILDTRYSATYLCYYLFKDYIKQYCNLRMTDTLPTLVSIADTKPDEKNDRYIPVVLTDALREKIKDRSIAYKRNANARLISSLDMGYESILDTLKVVYIKNALSSDEVKFNKCRFYGMYLNSYYRNMGGMNCYSDIYETLLSNDRELFKVLEIGKSLKELDINRSKLIAKSETLYIAKYNDKYIVGNSNTQMPNPDGINDLVKLVIRRVSSTKIKVTVMTTDGSVKNLGLNKVLKDLFGDMAQGGHKGISSINIPTREVNNFFKDLKNGHSYKYKNFEDMKYIYDNLELDIRGSELRKDEMTKRTFLMISVALFSALFRGTQKSVENMING